MADAISDLLALRPYLLADGAMGTNLIAAGLPLGEAPEPWNESAPDIVRGVHEDFIAAGADIVLTNTFGANAARLGRTGAAQRVGPLNHAGVAIARAASGAAKRPIIVAGALGPTGEAAPPTGRLDASGARAIFAEQAEALAAAGADVLWLETFTALAELEAALEAATGTGLPVVATMTYGADGRTLTGDSLSEVMARCNARAPGVVAIGANCGSGPASVIEILRAISEDFAEGATLVAKSNCGTPEVVGGQLVYPLTPAHITCYARWARDAGARIIGGCCGTTPAHLLAMAEALSDYAPRELPVAAEIAAGLPAGIDPAPIVD